MRASISWWSCTGRHGATTGAGGAGGPAGVLSGLHPFHVCSQGGNCTSVPVPVPGCGWATGGVLGCGAGVTTGCPPTFWRFATMVWLPNVWVPLIEVAPGAASTLPMAMRLYIVPLPVDVVFSHDFVFVL